MAEERADAAKIVSLCSFYEGLGRFFVPLVSYMLGVTIERQVFFMNSGCWMSHLSARLTGVLARRRCWRGMEEQRTVVGGTLARRDGDSFRNHIRSEKSFPSVPPNVDALCKTIARLREVRDSHYFLVLLSLSSVSVPAWSPEMGRKI